MDSRAFFNGRVTLHAGDCREVMSELPENSADSVVCDPPYHLTSGNAVYDFKHHDGKRRKNGGGFMGKQWDGGDVAFRPETWAEVLRVMKPGAHLVAFGGTRTYHRLACAIEDAGFEVRDAIMWHYGSGFPKSHDVSKGIEGKINGRGARYSGNDDALSTVGGEGVPGAQLQAMSATTMANKRQSWTGKSVVVTHSQALDWEGWGTALKPATEILVLARKPLSEPTVAANVLRWGTGAINVGGCRIGMDGGTRKPPSIDKSRTDSVGGYLNAQAGSAVPGMGRWPANVIHDGSEEVLAGFPESGAASSGGFSGTHFSAGIEGVPTPDRPRGGHNDNGGSAARFFYTAKVDADDRIGSKHPTVKPLDLIQYLCRLVTPPGGQILDCFAGTGTTGEAAWREGFSAILIEREPEYLSDIERRMALCLAGPDERARASIKARLKGKPEDHGPLFEGAVA